MSSLSGKVAVVTGAAGGIGGAVANYFADAGARLCLADVASASPLRDRLAAAGADVIDVALDVTRAESVAALVERTVGHFGGIDILVNVAGIVSFGAAETLDEAEWDRVLGINLKGTFLCAQAVIAPMRARGGGRIVNIGSIVGKNGGNARPWIDRGEQAGAANVAYGVSKAGVHALTLFLARELAADRITVNAVAPGPVASEMTQGFPDRLRALIPLGRLGRPVEVAAACAFLASDEASFITGEILDVNGGMWGD